MLLLWSAQNSQIHRDKRSNIVLTRGQGRRVKKSYFCMVREFQSEMMQKLWGWKVATVVQQSKCTSCHRITHLKRVKMVKFMLCILTTIKNSVQVEFSYHSYITWADQSNCTDVKSQLIMNNQMMKETIWSMVRFSLECPQRSLMT